MLLCLFLLIMIHFCQEIESIICNVSHKKMFFHFQVCMWKLIDFVGFFNQLHQYMSMVHMCYEGLDMSYILFYCLLRENMCSKWKHG
jgi:hypothetical protein